MTTMNYRNTWLSHYYMNMWLLKLLNVYEYVITSATIYIFKYYYMNMHSLQPPHEYMITSATTWVCDNFKYNMKNGDIMQSLQTQHKTDMKYTIKLNTTSICKPLNDIDIDEQHTISFATTTWYLIHKHFHAWPWHR